jgi:chromate reductase
VIHGKPVAVIGASTGSFGGVWAQAELKKVLRTAGARLVEGEVAVPRAHVRLDEDGQLLDDELHERLVALVDALLAEITPRAAVAA